MSDGIQIEICVESVDGVLAATAAGADRAELCADLTEGGITPSAGTMRAARDGAPTLGLMVMIRPRGGDFLYSDVELDVMRRDLDVAKDCGADGVVFGLLEPDGRVDQDRTARLVEQSRPLSVTFHRAFDMTPDPRQALEDLVQVGVDRVLTSGQQDCAADGVALLKELVDQAADRIGILPGGGLVDSQLREVLEKTGAREIHFAALVTQDSPMRFRNPNLGMGAGTIPGEYERKITDACAIRRMVERVRG